jgi:hypothetical protein
VDDEEVAGEVQLLDEGELALDLPARAPLQRSAVALARAARRSAGARRAR